MFRVQKIFKHFIRRSSNSSGSIEDVLNGRNLGDIIKRAQIHILHPEVIKKQVTFVEGPYVPPKEIRRDSRFVYNRVPPKPCPWSTCTLMKAWFDTESYGQFFEMDHFWYGIRYFMKYVDRKLDKSCDSASTEFIFGREIFKDAIGICPNIGKMVNDFFVAYRYAHAIRNFWKKTSTVPTIEEYLKVASIIHAPMQLTVIMLQQLYDDNKDLSYIVRLFSRFITICDDYCDFIPDDYDKDKIICESMTNGKLTLPVVYAYNVKKNTEVLDILKMRSSDDDVKKRFVSILDEMGSFEYIRKSLRTLDIELTQEILRFGKNEAMQDVIDKKLIEVMKGKLFKS